MFRQTQTAQLDTHTLPCYIRRLMKKYVFWIAILIVFGGFFYLSRIGKKPPVVNRNVATHKSIFDDLDSQKIKWSEIKLSTCGQCHWSTLPATHPAKGK